MGFPVLFSSMVTVRGRLLLAAGGIGGTVFSFRQENSTTAIKIRGKSLFTAAPG